MIYWSYNELGHGPQVLTREAAVEGWGERLIALAEDKIKNLGYLFYWVRNEHGLDLRVAKEGN